MADAFADLARAWGLDDRRTVSREGLAERYLYSADMVYRYAFGRWWGPEDVATTDVCVMLNPATGDAEQRHRRRWNGASAVRAATDGPES